MRTPTRLMAILSLAALLAGACSDSSEPTTGDSGSTSPPVSDPPTTTVPSTTTASPEIGVDPEPAAGNYAVASANPHATDAGMDVLANGGSAVDAAIAVQAVLGLVEPQSSGIGGGAFMLHYHAETGAITAYDGREEAPAGASPAMFLDGTGAPLGFFEASGSGHAVGTPGVVAMLALAHDDHGSLEWDGLFDSAITLADDGFEVSERMASSLGLAQVFGASDDFLALYSSTDGELLQQGDEFVNAAYADTLGAIADDWRALYEGDLAAAIVDAAATEPIAGTLAADDLARYVARRTDPLCVPYRGLEVCGAPPPTSGGVGVLSLMGQLANVDIAAEADTPAGWHLYIEASQRAYADRDLYVGDDRFVDVPTDALLAPGYLADRAATIDPAAATTGVEAGQISGFPRAADSTEEPSGTSHFVIVDAAGDVVTMTTSVESVFGSRRVAGGFVLNNQLTDFARVPSADGSLVANEIAPGKRPRSSMAPTLVLDEEGVVVALGSPGGSSIIAYVSKTLVGMLDWELSAEEAILLPNIVARSGGVAIEGTASTELVDALTALGHQVSANSSENSGIHLIEIHDDGTLTGAADPRREGTFATSNS